MWIGRPMCSRSYNTFLSWMGGIVSCAAICIVLVHVHQCMTVALYVWTQLGFKTDGRTDRHSSRVVKFLADQMSPRNLESKFRGEGYINNRSPSINRIELFRFSFWNKNKLIICLYASSKTAKQIIKIQIEEHWKIVYLFSKTLYSSSFNFWQ